jgi:tetratricopeptide (TPR) repeat protein
VLRRAAEVAPDYAEAYSLLGGALMRLRRDEEAMAAFRQTLRVLPSSPSDHANLGLLLARAGRYAEAGSQYRRALGLRPNHAGWLADLAWLLAAREDPRQRDPAEALRLAQKACRLTGRDPEALEALAAAQAADDNFRDALATAREASRIPGLGRNKVLAGRLAEQLRCYEAGRLLFAPAPPWTVPYAPAVGLAVDEKVAP